MGSRGCLWAGRAAFRTEQVRWTDRRVAPPSGWQSEGNWPPWVWMAAFRKVGDLTFAAFFW